MTAGLSLIKNVPRPIVESLLMLLGLTAATAEADAVILRKIYGSAATALIISNE